MATLVGQHDMKGETFRPRITGKANMKLVEKKLETSQKEGNVMTHMNGNNFGHKVIVEGSARTNFSTVIDATCLPITSMGSDVAELSYASTGIYASSFIKSSVESNAVEILTTPTEIMPPFIHLFA